MYIGKVFPLKSLLYWTKSYICIFLLISLIPVLLFDILGWKWLHLPWLPIGLLGTAVAFIQGFKNNASYDRLWEGRKIWGGIVNTSRTWTVMIKDFINNDFATTKVGENTLGDIHKEFVHRHVAWLTALRYQMRAIKPWEEHLKERKNNKKFSSNFFNYENIVPLQEAITPYLSPEEWQELSAKGNKASQLLGIQSRRLKDMKQDGLIDDFRHMELMNVVEELYTLQGKSERIKNFPYPRQFATLNQYFIWIFIILLPFGVMDAFESIGHTFIEDLLNHTEHDDHTGSIFHTMFHVLGEHFVWISVPFSALISWVFFTLELIGEATENPFEGGANDVPITDLARGIEIDIRQLIDDTDIPEPMEWKNNIVL